MKDSLKKVAEKRKERMESIYGITSDYSAYGPNCEEHPGERKLRIADTEKEKLGYKKDDMVWMCPICKGDKAYTNSDGTIAEQTKGFAAMDNMHRNSDPITDDSIDAAQKFSKAMGYEEKGI